MAPYLDIAAKLLGIELEEQKEVQDFDADRVNDENKEATDLGRYCDLGKILTLNNSAEQTENHQEENLEEQEILKVDEEPLEISRHDKMLEIDEEIDNYDTGDTDMGFEDNNNANKKNGDQEITRMEILNQNDEEEYLGGGKKKVKKLVLF